MITYLLKNSNSGISMNKRRGVLGSETVEELYEYKNLGVLKNYVGSFSSDAIEKWEMLFSASFN